jgi:hypothetical protein
MDPMILPPEVFLGAERRDSEPGKSWYYHLGAPDPWAIVHVFTNAPWEQAGTYDISVEFRLIGVRSDSQALRTHCCFEGLDTTLDGVALEIEARLIAAKQRLDQGLEAFLSPPPDKLDFWARLAG